MLAIRYKDVSKAIETMIETCDSGDKLPGVFVLANQFNAAPRTISKAMQFLAEKGKVTIQGTRGTFVSKPKVASRYRRIGVIGLLTSSTLELSETIKVGAAEGYEVTVISGADAIPSMIYSLAVDGLIFSYSTLTPEVIVKLRAAGIPFVVANRITEIPGINWVDFDNERILEQSLRHLASLGHKRIAYISFQFSLPEHQNRIRTAYSKMMGELCSFDESLFAQASSCEYFDKYGANYCQAYGREAAQGLLNLPNPPTAAFVADIKIAAGVASALQSAGFDRYDRFPIITTCEDGKEADKSLFSLVLLPYRERAQRAVKILLNILEHPDCAPIQELLPEKFILK